MSPQIKLYYFDAPGRGEATKMALTMAGMEYEFVPVTMDNWPTHKALSPNGHLPYMEVDGVKFAESHAMLFYGAKHAGLVPEDPMELMKCQMLVEMAEECIVTIFRFMKVAPEEKENMKKKTMEDGKGPLKNLEEALSRFHGKYAVGDKMTFADLSLATLYNGVTHVKAMVHYENSETMLPYLKTVAETTTQEPRLAKYYASL